MTRVIGPLLFVSLVLGTIALRTAHVAAADRILQGETRARQTLAVLHAASLSVLARGGPFPGLPALLEALPEPLGLEPVPAELLPDAVGAHDFARDEQYVYGATGTRTSLPGGRVEYGHVFRAWPRRYGVDGELEFHVTDDGRFLAGQNRLGRSGLQRGFPPPLPEPSIDQPDGPSQWWPEEPPAQR